MSLSPAHAIATAVNLGAADSFAVLGGQSVTNTGPSVITGDVGVSPGTSITGLLPIQVNGSIHQTDALAAQAQTDLTTAYNAAAGQAKDFDLTSPGDLGGLTLDPGVYKATSSINLTGTLTLDAHGDPNAVWVFQIGSTLITASDSHVLLTNGAAPCNVFWQVGSSATIGTNTTFVGNIMTLASIGMQTGATLDGRALAQTAGSVTLDTNRITRATCAAGTTGGTTAGTTGGTGGTTTTGGAVAGATAGGLIAGTTGGTTGNAVAGTTTGGGTGGALGGLLGGVLTTGGTTGGVLGGLIAGSTGGTGGATTGGGTTGYTTGGGNGGGHGGDHGGEHGGDHGGDHGGGHGGGYGGEHGGEHGGGYGGEHGGEHGGGYGGEHGGDHGGDHGGEHGGDHGGDHGGEHGDDHGGDCGCDESVSS
ncbi:ice-binding family protein [Kitasatospora cinereorecta]|uniref:Ice-binding family protein n=1 Tax=Kitasatospora cinereorecta TaxID=285560 RepID=A0ABW0V4G6_9ACTN